MNSAIKRLQKEGHKEGIGPVFVWSLNQEPEDALSQGFLSLSSFILT